MIVNQASLAALNVGFKANFQNGFAGAPSHWQKIATLVPSTTGAEEYGWIGDMPNIREWIGDRVVTSLTTSGYRISNRDFELTVAVRRPHIEDDNLGIYASLMADMGRSVAVFPDQLTFGLLRSGASTKCYDGQYFFDTDHPVGGQPVSNWQAGSGPIWALLDVSRPLRPLIYQRRKDFAFVAKNQPTDDNVFARNEFIYGVDGRCNVGYGLWQMAQGSRADLTEDNYAAARAALQSRTNDRGVPLGLGTSQLLLVCGPQLEAKARHLLSSEYLPGGGSNPWKGSAELLVTPWLAE
jgi:phage major head subunit gpT-like protein